MSKSADKVDSTLVKRVLSLVKEEMNHVPDGKPLPIEVELAAKFGVGRRTVRSAMARLESAGAVRRVRGKGTFPARGRNAHILFRPPTRRLALPLCGRPVIESISPMFGPSGFYPRVLEGIVEEAIRYNSEVVVHGGMTHEDRVDSCLRLCDDHRTDGILLVAVTDQQLLKDVSLRRKPVCLVDHFTDIRQIDCVDVDSAAGSAMAVEHLVNLGHKRIGYLDSNVPGVNPERMNGYTNALKGWNLEVRPEWIIAGNTSMAGGQETVTKLLALTRDRRPTALLAFSEDMALGVIEALTLFGLRVPEDISVVGVGGKDRVLTVGVPELTVVSFDSSELGRLAVRCLFERIDGQERERKVLRIAPSLQVGRSTARPAAME